MRNFDPDSLRALQDLDTLGAPEQPLSAGELDRLSAAVFARIEKPENEQRPAHPRACPAAQKRPPLPYRPAHAGRGRRCRLRLYGHGGGGRARAAQDVFRPYRLF